MKQYTRLRKIVFAALLMTAAVIIPVFADDEAPVNTEPYTETGTLFVPSETGETEVTTDHIYVTDPEDPGVDMTAAGQDISATVNGEVISAFGGAAIMTENGKAVLKAGDIRGGFGVSAILDGGTVDIESADILAGDAPALDILIPGSGTVKFSGTDLFSSFYGVRLLTGFDVESYTIESDESDDGWLDPTEADQWTKPDISESQAAENKEQAERDPSGSSETTISVGIVEAEETAVDIEMGSAGTVTLEAEDAVFSNDKGINIELYEDSGTVTLASPIIDAENQGLVIYAPAGSASVSNSDYISADSAVEITNDGGTVALSGGGFLEGVSGLYIEATGGTTTAEVSDIYAGNCGVQIWTYDADDDTLPESEDESAPSAENGANGETAASIPTVSVTVDGDITDFVDEELPDTDWDVEPDPDMEGIASESSGSTKDASESGQDEDPDEEASVGITVSAETESKIDISVKGSVSMSYGNEIEAFDNAQVTASVSGDVATDYGNRIGAYDGAAVNFTFGGNIDAGGKALETESDFGGVVKIFVAGSISGDPYGLDIDTYDGSLTEILAAETISGKEAGIRVNDEADNDGAAPDNLKLTAWQITPAGSVVESSDKETAETTADNILYIIKIDPDSQDLIRAVDENGKELQTSRLLDSPEYPVAKEGEKVCLVPKGNFAISAAYNGKDRQTALQKDERGNFCLTVPRGGGVWLSADTREEPDKPCCPCGDLCWLCGRMLPGTGFSASRRTELRERPARLEFSETGLKLQIPVLDAETDILKVPSVDGEYPVEWLDSYIGLLEQSSMPGEGVTVLTGHNHLNNTEAGPFLFIGKLEEGDRMMIHDRRGALHLYQVYGNYKIASDGFASIADEVCGNALVLITCEDEAMEGGYLNRRVILARPL